MAHPGSVVPLVMGIAALTLGITSRQFYGGGVGRLAKNNPVPTWFGKLWFIGFGMLMIAFGLKGLGCFKLH